jgi:hypothetical protein
MAEEAKYDKPTSQLDLEARLERENENTDAHVPGYTNPVSFGVENYVGTDPIYQNHANDTEAPLNAEEGAEKTAEELFRESHESHLQDPPPAKDEPDTKDPVEVAQEQHEKNLAAYEARQEQVKSDAQGPFAATQVDEEDEESDVSETPASDGSGPFGQE